MNVLGGAEFMEIKLEKVKIIDIKNMQYKAIGLFLYIKGIIYTLLRIRYTKKKLFNENDN